MLKIKRIRFSATGFRRFIDGGIGGARGGGSIPQRSWIDLPVGFFGEGILFPSFQASWAARLNSAESRGFQVTQISP